MLDPTILHTLSQLWNTALYLKRSKGTAVKKISDLLFHIIKCCLF